MSEYDAAWWRERLAGTTYEGLTPDEVAAIAAAQGVPSLPPAYEGFMLVAGRGCSHVWEPDMDAYYPGALELKDGADELLEENDRPFALGPDAVVITITGGYEFNFLIRGEPDPVVWHYLEGDLGPIAKDLRFSELVLGQLPGRRHGWRWDASGEAGPARWAVWHLAEDHRLHLRWLLRWASGQGLAASTPADLVRLAAEGRLPAGYRSEVGDAWTVDGSTIAATLRNGRRLTVEVVGDRATFGAAEVQAYARSCSPPVDVPLPDIEEALASFTTQDRLERVADGRWAVPAG